MKFDQFVQSIEENTPPQEISGVLKALWWDAKGKWDKAHKVAQDISSNQGAWIHAYLHRKEGDSFNARYWYRRAEMEPYQGTLDAEWEEIAKNLL